jgi:hypothetical protein
VRVTQVGCRLGLTQKALGPLFAAELLWLGDLEGDLAVQLRVVGPADDAEGALTHTLADLEAANAFGQVDGSDRRRGLRRRRLCRLGRGVVGRGVARQQQRPGLWRGR